MNNTSPNPIFAKFDQVLGKTTPTTSGPQIQTRADEIRSLAGGQTSNEPLGNDIYSGDTKVVGGLVGGIVRPVVEFGKDIAGAIGGGKYIGELQKLNKADQDAISLFVQKRNEAQKSGDSQVYNHFQNLIQNYKTVDGTPVTEIFPALNKSNEQIIGDAVGTAAAALSGGALETGASAIKGAQTVGQVISSGSKIGAAFGGTSAVGNAMEQGGSLSDVVKSGIVGTAVGAATGASSAGFLHGSSRLISGKVPLGSLSDAFDNIKSSIAKKNVPENLGESVDNLAKMNAPKTQSPSPTTETKTTPDSGMVKEKAIKEKVTGPLKTYDEFYNQEQKFKNNVKEDTALGKVGERIGNAYDKAIALRRNTGKIMEQEIGKVGNIKTDISGSFPKFEEALHQSGVTYDANKGEIISSPTSKMTGQDRSMLDIYVSELNKLGPNPTAGELDAFLSRIPNELDVYKGTNNITKVTNGERLIKGNLSDLRNALSPKANKAFTKYFKARSDYSALSDFLDEGSSFLGAKTQTGDYAKDASLAKSSVQSILNQGKKDWLLKLEKITGYPALDESMLAIQAMKDAGNFRGQSLLDLMTPKNGGKIPTSARGFASKAVDKAIEIGKEKFAGTPYEQTRRFIKERMAAGKKSIPSDFTPVEKTQKISPKKGLKNTQGGFAKVPFGETAKNVTPESVAGIMDARDLKTAREYLMNNDIQTHMDAGPMLKSMGIDNLNEKDLKSFLKEVINIKQSTKNK